MRIPPDLLIDALSKKDTRPLRLYLAAKSQGSRVEAKMLLDSLSINYKTGGRYIEQLVALHWIGFDGTYIFPRSWERLGMKKKYGQGINSKTLDDLKTFEAYSFTIGLKEIERRDRRLRSSLGSGKPKAISSALISKYLNLNERKVKRLKAQAKKLAFISVYRRYRVLGPGRDFEAFRRNIKGPAVFRAGKQTVTPDVSEIEIHI